MKKHVIVLFCFVVVCFTNSFLFAPEAEPAKVELKEPAKEYIDPKNEEEAKAKLDEADKEAQKAEEAKKEYEDEWVKDLGAMQKIQDKNSVDYKDALKKYNDSVSQWSDAGENIRAWEIQKTQLSSNEYVKQYQAKLAASYEAPSAPQEPSWWQSVTNAVSKWYYESKLSFYDLIGNTAKVLQVRDDLAAVYADLGLIVDQARNTKSLFYNEELALNEKIGKGLEALEQYKEALSKGDVSQGQKDALQDDVLKIVKDLTTMQEELENAGVDQKIRDKMRNEVKETLKALGVPQERIDRLEKAVKLNRQYSDLQKALIELRDISKVSGKRLNEILNNYNEINTAIDSGEFDFNMSGGLANIKSVVQKEIQSRAETLERKDKVKRQYKVLQNALVELKNISAMTEVRLNEILKTYDDVAVAIKNKELEGQLSGDLANIKSVVQQELASRAVTKKERLNKEYADLKNALGELKNISGITEERLKEILRNYNEIDMAINNKEFEAQWTGDLAGIRPVIEKELAKRAASQTPYAILGVPTTATSQEIRKAFLKKAAVSHPDKAVSAYAQKHGIADTQVPQAIVDEFTENWKRINNAYGALKK